MCSSSRSGGEQCKQSTAKGQYCWNHLRGICGLHIIGKKSSESVNGAGMGLFESSTAGWVFDRLPVIEFHSSLTLTEARIRAGGGDLQLQVKFGRSYWRYQQLLGNQNRKRAPVDQVELVVTTTTASSDPEMNHTTASADQSYCQRVVDSPRSCVSLSKTDRP